MVQTIIQRHGTGSKYTEKILSYCRQAHFQATLDEYAYLLRSVLQEDKPKNFLDHFGRAMGMWTGSPGVNERLISHRPTPQQTHFALAFGDEVSSDSMEANGKTRKSAVREAFNSPFWPFVLATTSVGQEGLDFHLYCRDIAHWNLPSNPVDLEQREGRINRYDGLSIRRNIARDFPLLNIKLCEGKNLWDAVFDRVLCQIRGSGRFKHGLFPHWIYQKPDSPDNISGSEDTIIRRHLLFYSGSMDRNHYNNLKSALSLYRLVFGQPRQQDILDQVLTRYPTKELHNLDRSLAKYMINLSPFDPSHSICRAECEAMRLLDNPEELQRVMEELPNYLTHIPTSIWKDIEGDVVDLVSLVKEGNCMGTKADSSRRASALAAILYLMDPYDAVYDLYGAIGFSDDTLLIRKTHAALFPS